MRLKQSLQTPEGQTLRNVLNETLNGFPAAHSYFVEAFAKKIFKQEFNRKSSVRTGLVFRLGFLSQIVEEYWGRYGEETLSQSLSIYDMMPNNGMSKKRVRSAEPEKEIRRTLVLKRVIPGDAAVRQLSFNEDQGEVEEEV